MREDHASVIRTIPTPTGQITLVINDDSYWKATALAVICESALVPALEGLASVQGAGSVPVPNAAALPETKP